MTFLLKIIAYGMIFTVAQKLFPTFWGGFITALFFVTISIIGSVKTIQVEKK